MNSKNLTVGIWIAIFVFASGLSTPAMGATIMGANPATLIEDTFIASTDTTTNYAGHRFLQLRAVSAATRATLIQFELPQLTPGQRIDKVELTLRSGSTASGYPAVALLGTTTAITMNTVTWNNAIADGILAGTGRTAAYTPDWGGIWTSFAGEPLLLPALSSIDPTGGTVITYLDLTANDGLLKFINETISTAGPTTIWLALGFAATETTTGGVQFRSQNDSGSEPAIVPPPQGPYTPTLTLTAIPEPASLGLLGLGVLLVGRRRRS